MPSRIPWGGIFLMRVDALQGLHPPRRGMPDTSKRRSGDPP